MADSKGTAPTRRSRPAPRVVSPRNKFAMGATASCADGPGGKVSRVIIDPATETVTHLVIQPKHRLGVGRLVPLDLVDATAGDIRLRCTVEEFGELEPAQETELINDGTGGLGIGGLNAPMGVTSQVPAIVQDVVPLGEADVDRGDPVHALDGEIGRVQGLLVDPDDHRVTHVLLQEGHLWGRKKPAPTGLRPRRGGRKSLPRRPGRRAGELLRL
jgi:sporulation protein YlmC with PRC-barrel domain